MPKNQISQREIARRAGVSLSAVSLALRNSPKISSATIQRVKAIARETGYIKDPRVTELMAHLRTTRDNRKSSNLAVLVPEIKRSEFSHYFPIRTVLEGLESQADDLGFNLDLFLLEDLRLGPERLRSVLITRGIKGMIVMPFRSGVGRIDFDFSGFCAATAGFSIIDPKLDRACPNYLQMMDELLEYHFELGYSRPGLVMNYSRGGIGYKLFSSSYLFFQTMLPEEQRIPILQKEMISDEGLKQWIETYRPDSIISAGSVYERLIKIGYSIPTDFGFASIDLSEPPQDACGVNHRYRLIGAETVSLVAAALNLNRTGIPDNPRVILVDSHRKPGFTLPRKGKANPINLRTIVTEKMKRQHILAEPLSEDFSLRNNEV